MMGRACNFCETHESKVGLLLVGMHDSCICSACVAHCVSVIANEMNLRRNRQRDALLATAHEEGSAGE